MASFTRYKSNGLCDLGVSWRATSVRPTYKCYVIENKIKALLELKSLQKPFLLNAINQVMDRLRRIVKAKKDILKNKLYVISI